MKQLLILHTTGLLTGVLLDLLIGDPPSLPHPVRAVGALISGLEKRLYKEERDSDEENFARGVILTVITVLVTAITFLAALFGAYYAGKAVFVAVEAVMTFYILAAKSLKDEAYKVYERIAADDIKGARYCLSMIVGRDTASLDKDAVIRAAVETVAENTSDGVIAPLLYTALGGPVLGMCYKAVNTMDSMIGYRNERYEYFGKAAARTDDALNLLPSRLAAILMIAGSYILGLFCTDYNGRRAFSVWRRDRRSQKSPNACQTESAAAGALGIRLLGDASYGGKIVTKPFIGDDTRPVEAMDIKRAAVLMFITEALCTAAILLAALILIFR
ncbi:MAG: cobalamin biosynthesis protein CobD [Lachnospiraceae bacterium]|nr:cobalamin biosynthesis protein CobD [Lachnospiraceae bacterium]